MYHVYMYHGPCTMSTSYKLHSGLLRHESSPFSDYKIFLYFIIFYNQKMDLIRALIDHYAIYKMIKTRYRVTGPYNINPADYFSFENTMKIWCLGNTAEEIPGRTTVGPPYLRVLHLQIQLTVDQKYFFKIPESFKNQNLNLLCTSNYLHSTYLVFTTIFTALTLY